LWLTSRGHHTRSGCACSIGLGELFQFPDPSVGSHFGVTIQLEENQRFNRKRVFENIHLKAYPLGSGPTMGSDKGGRFG
jgi:hypothetical protein